MSKYSSLGRVIRSHVKEDINKGNNGKSPLKFFLVIGVIFFISLFLAIKC